MFPEQAYSHFDWCTKIRRHTESVHHLHPTSCLRNQSNENSKKRKTSMHTMCSNIRHNLYSPAEANWQAQPEQHCVDNSRQFRSLHCCAASDTPSEGVCASAYVLLSDTATRDHPSRGICRGRARCHAKWVAAEPTTAPTIEEITPVTTGRSAAARVNCACGPSTAGAWLLLPFTIP